MKKHTDISKRTIIKQTQTGSSNKQKQVHQTNKRRNEKTYRQISKRTIIKQTKTGSSNWRGQFKYLKNNQK